MGENSSTENFSGLDLQMDRFVLYITNRSWSINTTNRRLRLNDFQPYFRNFTGAAILASAPSGIE